MPHRVNATVRPVGLEFIVTRLVRPVITAKIVKRNATAKMEQLATISPVRLLWKYGLCSFQTGGTKLERFLPKNQHPQGKLLNFKNWISGGLRSFQKSEF